MQQVQGLNVVVAIDDDSPAQIRTTLGTEGGSQPFVAVESIGGATAQVDASDAVAPSCESVDHPSHRSHRSRPFHHPSRRRSSVG